jgi:hypothetical protein
MLLARSDISDVDPDLELPLGLLRIELGLVAHGDRRIGTTFIGAHQTIFLQVVLRPDSAIRRDAK